MDERELNKSELVLLLINFGVSAHHGMSMRQLQELHTTVTLTGCAEGEPNPVNWRREEIMKFIATSREMILPQFGCDGNCYVHPDAQVVLCWMNMKGMMRL